MNGNDPSSARKVPDLYRLLKLPPQSGDLARIRQTLEQLAARAQLNPDPQAAQRTSRLLAYARHHLLDADRKQAYDAQWNQVHGATATEAWECTELLALLPKADPNADFDLAAHLGSDQCQPSAVVEQDFELLRSKLLGASIHQRPADSGPEAGGVLPQAEHAVATTSGVRRAPIGSGAGQRAQDHSPSQPAVASKSTGELPPSVVLSTGNSRSSSRRSAVRHRRDHSLLLMLGGALVTLGSVLAFLLYVLNRNATSAPPGLVQAQAPGPAENSSQPATPPPVRGSGLPSVPGWTGEQSLDPLGPANETPSLSEIGGTAATTPTEGMPPSPPEPGVAEPTSSERPTEQEPQLSDQDKQRWQTLLQQGRKLLGELQFDQADRVLDQAAIEARSSRQKDQLSRLRTVASLARQFHQILLNSMGQLEAGEVLQIGNQDIAFVESSADSITIRSRGGNRTLPLLALPLPVAFGLADLQLSLDNPKTYALKAAYAAVHPRLNSETIVQIRQWFEAAAEAGVVPTGTAEFADERYDLD